MKHTPRRIRMKSLADACMLAAMMAGYMLHGATAFAQDLQNESEGDNAQGMLTLRLSPVVVTATRIEASSFDLPVSIDAVEQDQIQHQQARVNLSESLVRVPGIVVQNRQNYAQDLQISSRGFGARATFGVRGVRLVADGIPATMPDGQGQTATFDLDTAKRIEVLRGPFSAIYGNASGGVIQIFTADGPQFPTLKASALAGSYGTRKLGIQFGGQAGLLNYIGSLSGFDTDGYRDHSATRRDQLNGKFRLALDADATLSLVVTALDQPETQDPLGLTREQVELDPRQAGTGALAFNTRKSIRHNQGGLTYERRLSSEDTVHLMGYFGQRSVRQFLAFTGTSPTSSGGVIDLDSGFGGLGLRWTRVTRLANSPFTLTAGIDSNRMEQRRKGYVNDYGIAGALKRDENDVVHDLDQYVQAKWEASPRWTLSAGIRHSKVQFDSTDYFITASSPDDSGNIAYSNTSPMLGVLYHLTPSVNLYANAGKGFETPTFSELAYKPDGTPGLNFVLRPSTSKSYEVGVKAFVGADTRVNAALFHIDTDDEIVSGPTIAPGRSTYVNAAKTQRDGLEISVDSNIGHGWKAYLAYTWIAAQYKDFIHSNGANLSGNTLPGVPLSSLYGEISWAYPATGFSTTLSTVWNNKVYVNDDNTETASSYAVASWRAGFKQSQMGWTLEEFVRVDNLFNRNYIGSVIVNASSNRFYEPAPLRNYLVGIDIRRAF
ncbi:MAG: TonB-dependent receptor [Thiobacillus sp.]|nr:TonB-dependent receptor [Thiobacillus sp.]